MLTPDDAEFVAANPQVPGLRVLLDCDLALEMFQRHLPQIQPVQATCNYLRYKPATSCMAAFTVCTSTGVMPVHAVAYATTVDGKLEKSARGPFPGTPRHLAPVVCRDLNGVLWPFPLDDELKYLGLTGDQKGLSRLLGRLNDDLGASDDVRLTALRYKPGRRFVGRIDEGGNPKAVLRLQSATAYARSRRAAKSLGTVNVVRTPATLGHSDGLQALLLEWLDGHSLSARWTKSTADLAAVESAGSALAALHQLPMPKLPRRDKQSVAASIAAMKSDAHIFGPETAQRVGDLAGSCLALHGQTSEQTVAVHGDFHPGQIIIASNGAVGLIDFDRACRDHPYADLGTFLAELERLVLAGRCSAEEGQRLQSALLAGYFASDPQRESATVSLFTSIALLKRVHEPFRLREASWRTQTAALLSRASELLETAQLTRRSKSSQRTTPSQSDPCAPLVEDEKLPHLPEALDVEAARAMLEEVVQDVYQNARLKLASARLIRHKPGRRCLIAYAFADAASKARLCVLGKIDAKGRHRRRFRLQHDLWSSGFDDRSADQISTPRPVGLADPWNMWLQEFVPGMDGWQALAGPQQQYYARRISRAVDKLSQSGIPIGRSHGPADELQILEEKLPLTLEKHPRLRARIERILAGCRRLVANLSENVQLAIHRDFYPDQVVVKQKRVYVLDHDLVCLGDPLLDVGNFCAHLIERSIREPGGSAVWRSAAEQVRQAFLVQRSDCEAGALESYVTLSLARHIYLSTRIPGRQSSTLPLLSVCQQRLERACWAPNPSLAE